MANPTNTDVQTALTRAGFSPGLSDGRLGAATTRAVKAFQVANALSPDGKLGPLTLAKLFPASVPSRPEAAGLPTFPPSPDPVRTSVAGTVKNLWPLQRDCMTFYGGVGLHQTTLLLPYPMKLAWDKSVTVSRITLHEKVAPSAGRAFAAILAAYPSEAERRKLGIDIFGGSLNVRKMRGGNSYSMHSWGIAIDFDPERNQLKWGRDKARLAQPDARAFWEAWAAEGWVSLGQARNFDWMHVQAARL